MDTTTLPEEVRQLLAAARQARAEAEQLEARARAKRDELGQHVAALVHVYRIPKRALTRLLNYRSDNSVRRKARAATTG